MKDNTKLAGNKLRQLIKDNYLSQEEFACDYGLDIRTVNRHINNGINKIDIIQEYAEFFNISFLEFFTDEEIDEKNNKN